tara:strand:+ start:385 stop:645 length:261 start_codon:yes stop_codon:yes gene_type:complete
MMIIVDFDKQTNFDFVCDLIIDNNLIAHFDDANVTRLTDLLKEHSVTNWQVSVGMNEKHQRTISVQVHEKIPPAFDYDLTNIMLTY